MRRTFASLAVAAIALGTIAANEAPVMPDPVDFTFHLHGDQEVPLSDDDGYATFGKLVMDTTAPTQANPQSRQLTNYVGGPNTKCSDNAFFPTWVGWIGNGTVKGDATLTIDVVGGLGGNVEVRIWADTAGGCNDANVLPFKSVVKALPMGNGKLTVTLPLDGLDPTSEMKLMIVPTATSPTSQARFVYDSTTYKATLSFSCQPDAIDSTKPKATDGTCRAF